MAPYERMSEQEYQVLLARNQALNDLTKHIHEPDPGPESELQSKIKAHCKTNGWPALCFPRTKNVLWFLLAGWPDATIIMPHGRVLFLELKAAKKDLRKSQRLMRNMFQYLGHEIHKVRSFRRFLQLVEGTLRRE